jgi:hypothetical protein
VRLAHRVVCDTIPGLSSVFTRTNLYLASILVLTILPLACDRTKRSAEDWRVGGLYSTSDGKGQYGVVKILALDPDAVHVRLYKQKFPSRPGAVDPLSLTLGKLEDKDGFSIGHLPLSRKTFASWEPVFVSQQSISDSELEGYKMWKEAKGGVF